MSLEKRPRQAQSERYGSTIDEEDPESSPLPPLSRTNFHENDFDRFLWFNLLVATVICLTISAVVYLLAVTFIPPGQGKPGLVYLEALPTVLAALEIWITICCLSEKYFGRGCPQTTPKSSKTVQTLLWLWTVLLFCALVVSEVFGPEVVVLRFGIRFCMLLLQSWRSFH